MGRVWSSLASWSGGRLGWTPLIWHNIEFKILKIQLFKKNYHHFVLAPKFISDDEGLGK